MGPQAEMSWKVLDAILSPQVFIEGRTNVLSWLRSPGSGNQNKGREAGRPRNGTEGESRRQRSAGGRQPVWAWSHTSQNVQLPDQTELLLQWKEPRSWWMPTASLPRWPVSYREAKLDRSNGGFGSSLGAFVPLEIYLRNIFIQQRALNTCKN